MKTENKKTLPPFLALVALYLSAAGTSTVGPIIYKISEAFPEISMPTIRLISTLPALVNCTLGLIIAALVGKKFSYTTVLKAGVVLLLIGTTLPAFLHSNFYVVLASRFIAGLGMGCFACKDVVLAKLFPGPQAAKLLGYGAALTTGVNTVFQLISGILGDINWAYSFYLGLFTVIPLLIIYLRFHEPVDETAPESEKSEVAAEERPKNKGKIRPIIFFYFIRLALLTVCSYPFLGFISVFVAERGLGGAAQSSWCTSAYTLGIACASMFFGYLYNKLGRIWFGTACFIVVLGFVSTLSAYTSVFFVILGGFLLGIGFNGVMMFSIKWAQTAAYKETMAISSTLIALAVSIGSFFSSYWMILSKKVGEMIPLFETEIEKTFFIGIFIFAVFGLLALIKDPRPKAPEEL